MKNCSKAFSCIILLFFCLPVLAGEKEDFSLLIKYFKEKNYPMVRNVAPALVDKKEYRYHVKFILAETYFQENDLYTSRDILKELLDEYPAKEDEIKSRLVKVEKELNFISGSNKEQDKRFQIFWGEKTGENKTVIAEVSNILDDAYRDGGRFFGWYPEENIVILLYYGDEYAKYTVSPPWSGASYDGKMRIRLYKNISKERLKELIYHEYAHVAIQGIVGNNCPLWFNEAVAQYFGQKYAYGLPRVDTAQKTALKFEDFPTNWSSYTNEQVKKLYDESLRVLMHIISKSSEYVIHDTLAGIAKNKSFRNALDDALSMYGLNSKLVFE